MITLNHSWDVSFKEAVDIQRQLSKLVVKEDRLDRIDYLAGVDVGFEKSQNITRAAVAVLSFPDLELVEQSIISSPITFPYIPGLLSLGSRV